MKRAKFYFKLLNCTLRFVFNADHTSVLGLLNFIIRGFVTLLLMKFQKLVSSYLSESSGKQSEIQANGIIIESKVLETVKVHQIYANIIINLNCVCSILSDIEIFKKDTFITRNWNGRLV